MTPQERRATAVLCAATAAVASVIFLLARGALADDSYITLTYARTLAEHGTWGLLPGAPSNAATSPLNVMLLTAVITLLPGSGTHPVLALGLLFVAAATILAWCWCRLARQLRLPLASAVLGSGLVLLNPFVVSSIGLEPILWATLLAGLLLAAIRGSPVTFGVLTGLIVLTRPDMVVFALVLALASRALRRGWYRAVAAAVTVALPWSAWSWLHFGSAIPDTFVIKTVQRAFVGYGLDPSTGIGFATGPQLLAAHYPVPTIAAAVGLVLGGGVLVAALGGRLLRRAWAARFSLVPMFGLAGLAHYLVYLALGVPPYIWYYAPVTVALSGVLAVGIGVVLDRHREPADPSPSHPAVGRRWRPRTIAVAVCGIGILGGTAMADLAGLGVPWARPPMYGNWALPREYQRIAHDLGERIGDAPVAAPGEIGALAYFCHCTVIDPFSDRAALAPLVARRIDTAGPLTRWLLELNYRNFRVDPTPAPVQWKLRWSPGHVPPRHDVWNVHSPALGDGHFVLRPVTRQRLA